ncbi:MAG: hypothetical protein ACE5FH_01450 [Candidatus Zixiibacteriota bacterium]
MVSQEYIPCSTIARIHEHKSEYQPNMTRALCLVIALSISVALFLAFLPGPSVVDSDYSAPGDFIAADIPAASGETANKRQLSSIDVRPAAFRAHTGFAGMMGYAIVKDIPIVHNRYEPEPPTTPLPVLAVSDGLNDFGFESVIPADYDFGLPPPVTFLSFESSRRDLGPIGHSASLGFMTPPMDIPKRYRPPLLKLQPVRYPRKGSHLNGKVTMVLVVDNNGSITESRLVSEEPKGHDFARSLKEALYESVFFPPRVNGRKVGIRYEFTYEFCWECPEKSVIEVRRGDLMIKEITSR